MHVLQHQKPHVNGHRGSPTETAVRAKPSRQDKLAVLKFLRDIFERASGVESIRNFPKSGGVDNCQKVPWKNLYTQILTKKC